MSENKKLPSEQEKLDELQKETDRLREEFLKRQAEKDNPTPCE